MLGLDSERVPPTSAARESPEEALGHDFGAGRKRLCVLKVEQDSEQEEDEMTFHPQKRARMSAGENF